MVGDGSIAVMRRKFAASRRRKLCSNDKPAKRLKTSQQHGARQDSDDLRGHPFEDRLNTPSEDERAQKYLDDIDREVLGPNYKRILEVQYALCRRDS